ncbi:MAG: glycine zipper 2TM domain-containing protein [Neisseria sp.]|nr:glycine zipper 2TM domain-containing protein [Neisseria sp.]
MRSTLMKTLMLTVIGLSLVGCANMTTQQRNTAIGVAAGAAIGHAVGGNTEATLGGAALGGVIGSQVR